MAYENLPGIEETRLDGNLTIAEANADPVTVVLGTATQGYSDELYQVRRLSDAARIFAKDGTLIRGMYEVAAGGSTNIRLMRIGATSAKLENVGGGITIETIAKDDTIGDAFEIFWENSTGRLRVWRVSDDELVYDNNPAYPLLAVDLGEVAVTGAVSGATSADIGTLVAPKTLTASHGEGGTPTAVYTDGTDGATPSRMELYEALYNAYELLEDQNVDLVVPMNAYLDDKNVMDMTVSGISALALSGISTYPDMGDATDVLGMFRAEEYDGKNYFWWFFPANPSAPGTPTANIFPTVGSANATHSCDGTVLTAADFHEVNFAHQLATFCYIHSTYVIDCLGTIGVLPPLSYAPRDVSRWVGKLPVHDIDSSSGNDIISVNGSGLLGNKFMAGRLAAGGLTGFTVNNVAGLFGGGFIATDDGFLDGTQEKDDNDQLIDIGAYISVVATYPILANSSKVNSYLASGAPTYGGFFSNLPANQSPANQVLSMVRLPFRVNPTKINDLAGVKYVTFHVKPKGIVVSDAPTAARTASDYRRLTTVRIVKAVIDDLRDAAEPFLGKPLSELREQALDGALGERLKQRVKDEYINRFDKSLQITPTQRILGQAVLELTLVPCFELRKLFIVVSLAAV
jgi:hypothetical protein